VKRVRKAYRAGQFYPGRASELKSLLKGFFSKLKYREEWESDELIAGVSPHAGYVFSGQTAAHFYNIVKDYSQRVFLMVGPNHTGMGEDVSVYYPEGSWKSPFGETEIEGELAEYLHEKWDFPVDEAAHLYEHSLEVQLPFLQYVFSPEEIKIVPICLRDYSLSTLNKLSDAIYDLKVKFSGLDFIYIASTDLNHFGDSFGIYPPVDLTIDEFLEKKDWEIIDKVKNASAEDFYEVVESSAYTMCGSGPVYVALRLLELLEGKKRSILHYSNSLKIIPGGSGVGYLAASLGK
jgi:AmmeMemoRadiSam system protein B